MAIKRSYIWAGVIAITAVAWLASGGLRANLEGDDKQATSKIETAAQNAKPDALFKVSVKKFIAKSRREVISLPGRTEAVKTVEVRARSSGIVEQSLVKQGQKVKPGDVLCVLDMMTRNAQLQEAKAQMASAQRDYSAAKALSKRKITTATKLASEQARLDAAQAKLQQVELDITWTKIAAPVTGIVAERPSEEGSLLQQGQTCAKIAVMDPVLVTGQIAERDVAALRIGQEATAKLISGETVTGTLRFISPIADILTRTFRVEITVPNSDGAIRDGLTAEIFLPLAPVTAQLLPAGIIGLNDQGQIGVKAIDGDNRVMFMPVKAIAETRQGTWVTGLPPTVTLIIIGQDYVLSGQQVEPVTGASL